jgi:hypothetical protein
MSNELQSNQNHAAPTLKKAWMAPKIATINLAEARTKGTGLTDRSNFKSH